MPDLKKHLKATATQLRKEAAELLALAVRLDRLADPMPYNAEMASESYRRRLDEMTPTERFRMQYGNFEDLPEPAVSNEQLEAAARDAWGPPRYGGATSVELARKFYQTRGWRIGERPPSVPLIGSRPIPGVEPAGAHSVRPQIEPAAMGLHWDEVAGDDRKIVLVVPNQDGTRRIYREGDKLPDHMYGGKRPMLEGEGRVEPELPVVPDDAVTQLYDDIAHDVRSRSDATPESRGPMKVSTWLRDAITFDDTLRDE